MLTIAADPKHLSARIGITSVPHTWGSAMTRHPHIHMIVPGGWLAQDGSRWILYKPNFPAARARALEAVPAADADYRAPEANGAAPDCGVTLLSAKTVGKDLRKYGLL
jgi:hypothetical protein